MVEVASRKAEILNSFPLAPMQHGMLYHFLSDSGDGVDLEQIQFSLHEPLDIEAFSEAWRGLIERHPALRTSFDWLSSDEPVQNVHREAPLSLEQIDLRSLSADEQAEAVERLREEDRRRGFQLDNLPLMRLHVAELATDHFEVLWSFPHILFDGRSFPDLLQELFELYVEAQSGSVSHPDPATQRPAYKDHVEWLGQQDWSRSESFWRDRLQGFTASTPTPGWRETTPISEPTDDEPSEGAARYSEPELRLDRATTASLTELAQANGLSLNTLVQGAWALCLSRFSGEDDVVFGATRACRRSSIPDAQDAIGVFINTLPVRVPVEPQKTVIQWLSELRSRERATFEHEQTPLVQVQQWSEVPPGTPLFRTLVMFDNYLLGARMQALGGDWERRDFTLYERTGFELTLYGNVVDDSLMLRLGHDPSRFEPGVPDQILTSVGCALEQLATHANGSLETVDLLPGADRQKLLVEWNATEAPYDATNCLHQSFERQVELTPDATALAFQNEDVCYAELDRRANRLARKLRELGCGPDQRVALFLDRSIDLVVGVLGVLKAGGAYVPLDPTYPNQRIELMLEDSGAEIVVLQESLRSELPSTSAHVLSIDGDADELAELSSDRIDANEVGAAPHHLAYVIYTSGSTGRPKGVMVEHRNVQNFFTGMDDSIPHDPPGVWLAVTSLSFDISVLELLWTLCRGFKVVLYSEAAKVSTDKLTVEPPATSSSLRSPSTEYQIDLGLMYFAADESQSEQRYQLLLDGARFADQNGLSSVWVPERHFHAFGGLYPNPAVAMAAVATVTNRVRLRAGSVVLPLHHPARIAEEWAIVDNLSGGRVDLSFAAGWHPNDFILRPENYQNSKQVMLDGIDVVCRLWRGESVAFPDALGKTTEIATLPRPIQPELSFWVTTAGNPETYRQAGALGANILTHLLGQTPAELGEKIAVYREARREHGHDGPGIVSLMLHTFVGEDDSAVRDMVREPMISYLGSSLGLVKNFASSWTAFKKGKAQDSGELDLDSLTAEEHRDLLSYSFERYYETSGLFGTPERCRDLLADVAASGVDEVPCLIDFGVDTQTTLTHLDHLPQLRQREASAVQVTAPSTDRTEAPAAGEPSETLSELIERHGVTHLQCTPSMASLFLLDPDTRSSFAKLSVVMIGGEAFPLALARELGQLTSAKVINMYGPTETTIWSSTEEIASDPSRITIGRPIANTQLYVLDEARRPVPPGVVGELFIGGAGVVRGYWQRPELTAERFLDNPFRADERMYRTGDLARFLTDGRVEFLGRSDFQVKVRGHRIELGEIEARLGELDEVREAVVLAREDSPGDQRLVAYVLPVPSRPTDEAGIRDALRNSLPEFMVPAHVVSLDEFPLTPNGKTDRKALPAPHAVTSKRAEVVREPANVTEEKVAAIWRDVLNIAEISTTDNFFDLGGHSLLAVRVHRALREQFESSGLQITDLFRFPTIEKLALHLGASDEPAERRADERVQKRRQALGRRRRLVKS